MREWTYERFRELLLAESVAPRYWGLRESYFSFNVRWYRGHIRPLQGMFLFLAGDFFIVQVRFAIWLQRQYGLAHID